MNKNNTVGADENPCLPFSKERSSAKKRADKFDRSYIFLIVLFFWFTQFLSAQIFDESTPKLKNRSFGIGGHVSMAPFGVSIQKCFGNSYSVQFILGYFSISDIYFSNFVIRGKYRFEEIQETEPYIFASAGIINAGDRKANVSESIPLYSVGAGIDFNHGLVKNVFNSYEIGYMYLKTQKTNFTFSSLSYSFGVHYYYMR